MATVIGDIFADTSRFHTMIAGTGLQRQHSHDPHFQSRSVSRSRDRDVPTQQARAAASPRRQGSTSSSAPRYSSHTPCDSQEFAPADTNARAFQTNSGTITGGAPRLPSPPPSSSPSEASSGGTQPHDVIPATRPSVTTPAASSSSASSTSTNATITAAATRPMPSPESDTGKLWLTQSDLQPGFSISDANRASSPSPPQKTIHVRDLAHIQSLAKAELLTATGPGILNDPPLQQMKYEISGMPIGDIIEMVAALLTKITTTNDLQHDALNRNATHVKQAQAQAQAKGEEGGVESSMSPMSSSVLAFHGKNVPAITILSYLSRIHKYCPTTYEVFLSLLVYFDRMTERVNDIVVKSEEAKRLEAEARLQKSQTQAGSAAAGGDMDTAMRDDDSDETDSDLADDDDAGEGPRKRANSNVPPLTASPPLATYFVVDSFNIHRLIIAGVTCASKFFSDVFYTNSRYAKVGGLPLAELNHLELQFLLLNDFRLAVPVEDLEAYATMLVEFYAREVIAQKARPVGVE